LAAAINRQDKIRRARPDPGHGPRWRPFVGSGHHARPQRADRAQTTILIVTAITGGTCDSIGATMARMLCGADPSLHVDAGGSGNSTGNVRLIARGEIEFGLTNGVAATPATWGEDMFEGDARKGFEIFRAFRKYHASRDAGRDRVHPWFATFGPLSDSWRNPCINRADRGSRPSPATCREKVMPIPDDRIIRSLQVIDGPGRPALRAQVHVRGDRISAIRPARSMRPAHASETARSVAMAQGVALTPGCIDVQTRNDMALIRGPVMRAGMPVCR